MLKVRKYKKSYGFLTNAKSINYTSNKTWTDISDLFTWEIDLSRLLKRTSPLCWLKSKDLSVLLVVSCSSGDTFVDDLRPVPPSFIYLMSRI